MHFLYVPSEYFILERKKFVHFFPMRGVSIFDVLNRGNEPTILVANRGKLFNIMLESTKYNVTIKDWSVSTDCSFSYIKTEEKQTERNNTQFCHNLSVIHRSILQSTIYAFDWATSIECRTKVSRCKCKQDWRKVRENSRYLFNAASKLISLQSCIQ